MTPILITIEPFDLTLGARRIVRVASASEASAYALQDQAWQPKIAIRPRLSIELFSPDLSGTVQEGQCRFSIHLNGLKDENGVSVAGANMKWAGAPVNVYVCPDLVVPATPSFKGEIRQPNYDADTRILTASCAVNSEFLDGPLLTLEFNGDGAAGGEPEIRGELRPAGFGACENIPPVWFDTARWIGQIDGYGNTVSIDRLTEGLDDRGAPVADYADYATLAAAIDAGTVIPGRWATCIAEGLIGLGAPPEYPIGVNATFGSNRLGAIIQRILTVHNGVSVSDIDTSSLTSLDATVDFPARWWTAGQREIRDLVQAMTASANATPLVGLDGRFAVTRAVTTPAVATIDRYGSTKPRVTAWRSALPQVPVWRISARVARPSSTLEYDEVLYKDDIIDFGLYNPLTVYRAGNVAWTDDGASYLYISDTPAAGLFPPDNPASWQLLTPPKSGIVSTLYPAIPPAEAIDGSYYHDENLILHRKDTGAITINGEAITINGEDITFSGYVSVQDLNLQEQIFALQSIDDDGVISISEKKTILIPREQEFEAEYQALTDQATLFGLTLTELDAARTAWLALRDGLSPAWDDKTQPTSLPSRSNWDQLIGDYATERNEAKTLLAGPTAVNIAYPEPQIVDLDSAGDPKGGELPRTLQIAVFRGNTNITTGDGTTYSRTDAAGITSSIDNTLGSGTKGELTITDVDNSGYIDIDVTVDGISYPTQRLLVTANQDNGATGTFSANTYTLEIPLDNGDVVMEQAGKVTVPANSSVTINFSPVFAIAPNGQASGVSSDTSREGGCGVQGSPTTSQMTIVNSAAESLTANWTAKGKK